jgi:hypothetical protein
MTRMRKAERREYVSRRSRELAMSGKFDHWPQIEFELRFIEGFPEARQWLDSHSTRRELDQLCSQAKERLRNA